MRPALSIVIPTHQRPGQLARLIASLARQDCPPGTFETLVAIDGPDTGESRALLGIPLGAELLPGAQAGPAAARNRAIKQASGEFLLLLNDDVIAERSLVSGHLMAQRERAATSRGAMILGAAPWVVGNPDRLFDRLIRETSMVFFYDQMIGPPAENPDHDWGFRHCWTLNLSVPTALVREVGGFCESLPGAQFEDVELGWKLAQRFETPVLYRPELVVHHDHRYQPAGFLAREVQLGRAAWALAGANPACALDLFGRDIRSEDEIAYSKAFVEREEAIAYRISASFKELAGVRADAAPSELIQPLYEQHLLAKRWHWRRGLLEAAAGSAGTIAA